MINVEECRVVPISENFRRIQNFYKKKKKLNKKHLKRALLTQPY